MKYYYIKYQLERFPTITHFEDILNKEQKSLYFKMGRYNWEKCYNDEKVYLNKMIIIEKKTYNTFKELILNFPELILL